MRIDDKFNWLSYINKDTLSSSINHKNIEPRRYNYVDKLCFYVNILRILNFNAYLNFNNTSKLLY